MPLGIYGFGNGHTNTFSHTILGSDFKKPSRHDAEDHTLKINDMYIATNLDSE